MCVSVCGRYIFFKKRFDVLMDEENVRCVRCTGAALCRSTFRSFCFLYCSYVMWKVFLICAVPFCLLQKKHRACYGSCFYKRKQRDSRYQLNLQSMQKDNRYVVIFVQKMMSYKSLVSVDCRVNLE